MRVGKKKKIGKEDFLLKNSLRLFNFVFFFTTVHPIQGPRATQCRRLLKAVAVWAVSVRGAFYADIWEL